jgi:hypothetical protein
MTETTTAETDKPLSHTEYKTLKAIARGHVIMTTARPGSWVNTADKYTCTSTVLRLLQAKLAKADPTYTDGRRGCRVTQAGNVALSRARRTPPTKRGR